MTPEKKAELLSDMYLAITIINTGFPSTQEIDKAKNCSLIMVNEMIRLLPSVNGRPPNYQDVDEHCKEYWIEVKYYITKKVKG